MDIEQTADEFEKIVNSDTIEWHQVDPRDLDEFGYEVCSMLPYGTSIEIGSIKVGNSYILRTDDDYLKYVDIYVNDRKFMFCEEGHHSSIKPKDVSVYSLTKDSNGHGELIKNTADVLWPNE